MAYLNGDENILKRNTMLGRSSIRTGNYRHQLDQDLKFLESVCRIESYLVDFLYNQGQLRQYPVLVP